MIKGQTAYAKMEAIWQKIPAAERHKYVPRLKDEKAKAVCDKQLGMYAPCGCGSGKKYRFCCYGKKGAA